MLTMMVMMTTMTMMAVVIFVPGDLTLECEEDAERYQLKIEESLQVIIIIISIAAHTKIW